MNIQIITVILLFTGAAVFVGVRIYRNLTAKSEACCGNCGNEKKRGKA